MELFTATGKMKKVFLKLEMFHVCTTGETAHIDKIFKLLPHTHVNMLTRACVCVWQQLEYRIDMCHVTCGAHMEHL
jgi:hypothetical protein